MSFLNGKRCVQMEEWGSGAAMKVALVRAHSPTNHNYMYGTECTDTVIIRDTSYSVLHVPVPHVYKLQTSKGNYSFLYSTEWVRTCTPRQ